MKLLSLLISALSLITTLTESKVCPSLDVRNDPEYISKYKDCRVIEGHLQVVLIEKVEDFTEYFGNSFFELNEITDYLLIYRVMNLPSLGLIFPNLTTIKGNNLFLNRFAIVLYEMPELEEIGLPNLNSIGRGIVKINNCDKLCYVNTVNWDHLGASSLNYEGKICENAECTNECGGFCWNNYECQNMIKTNCHDLCIGCSKSNSTRHCHLCKYYNDSGNCVYTCPPSKLVDDLHNNCITSAECVTKNGWSVYNNMCVPVCPDWFERSQNGTCVQNPIKTCSGFKITTHSELDQFTGCNHINGALEFVTTGFIDTLDFERALGSIETISSYLKIVRSDTITTLNFFRSLKKIQGEDLWSGNYSLFVAQNQNLQQLFVNTTNVIIEKGEVLFQDNPHLCESEIKKVQANYSRSNNNGYHTACGSTPFNFTIVERNSTNVTLQWKPENNTAGYIFYYVMHEDIDDLIRLKDRVVDKESFSFDGGWDSLMTSNNTVLIKNLVPFTDYDFFIITIFINQSIVESPIFNFKTATDDPSDPLDLEAEAQSDSSISLKWVVPNYKNGILSYYKLTVYEETEFYPNLLQQRNYCLHPVKKTECDCPLKEEVYLLQSNGSCFGTDSDFCTNTIYQIEKAKTRRKRSAPIIEEIINATTSKEQIYAIYGLRHFTLYNFFMEACNKLDSDQIQHCSGKTTTFQRTKKKPGADDITNVSIKIESNEVTISWEKLTDGNGFILAYYIEYLKKNSSVVICKQSINFERNVCKVKISRLSEGQYSVRVWASSLAGEGKKSDWKVFVIAGESSGMKWVYGFLGFFSFVASMIIGLILWNKYKMKKEQANDYNMIIRMNAERNICDDDDLWRLDDETVEIVKELRGNSLAILYRRN